MWQNELINITCVADKIIQIGKLIHLFKEAILRTFIYSLKDSTQTNTVTVDQALRTCG